MELNFPACLRSEFPLEFPCAWQASEAVIEAIRGVNLSELARHSPGLENYDWAAYLRLSVIRMVRARAALQQHGIKSGRLLDIGSYLGNFSLMFKSVGYEVEALDSYDTYRPAMNCITELLALRGVTIRQFQDIGADLFGLEAESYDAVICMGVIEHIPHTPRLLLEGINRALRPGGLLVADTPNLAYLYKRQALARGDTTFCPIELQYHTEIPFEGHHREYTIAEIKWMLEQVGHDLLALETFNFSLFGLSHLTGRDLDNYRAMEAQEDLRELIFSVSRKPLG